MSKEDNVTDEMISDVAGSIMSCCTITIKDSDFDDMMDDLEIEAKHKNELLKRLKEKGIIHDYEWDIEVDTNNRDVVESIESWAFFNSRRIAHNS